ncbi:MAG TPA: hypothetical protein VN688_22210 [Gemmataceae bacterium]|nr:hypothetical protein [Gemmataceae bacterium]
MPRPCLQDHPLSPHTCRVCHWCADLSEKGAFHRRLWGEPEPDTISRCGALVVPPREIVPGLPDPIPQAELHPLPPSWPRLPEVMRKHGVALARLARAEIPPPGPRQGAGVLLIGGGRFWPGIVVAVKMLRDTGSRLPVQIWHRGSEEPVRLQDLDGVDNIQIHDLTTLTPRPRVLRGWEAKTVALLACGWERIFFLDADAYCLADPAPLLECLTVERPFLFWEDMPSAWNAVNWSAWGLGNSTVPPIQGGQFVLHVGHFWRELVLAHWINQHSDFSYSHQFGDQDAWRVALTVTGGASHRLGPARWDGVAFVCEANGRPLVVHRCQAKMFYPEDTLPGDGASNRRLPRLPGETRAWAHWENLLASRRAADVFGRVYSSGVWGPGETSGAGSSPQQAQPYLDLVNGLLKVSGWRRVIDLGCGDGYVATRLQAPEVVGVDCHAPHIHRLGRESPQGEWLHLDLDRDRDKLPAGDVAFLKDVLHHWPNRLIHDWLTWARHCGKWRWLICTQDRHQDADNRDCPLGGYRALDLSMEPLRSLDLVPLCHYLHKSVLLLERNGTRG